MFKQENRLKSEKDVEAVYKKGKGVFDSACGIKYRKNNKEQSRFAVVVGTKVHKSAVKRNRIRRQYREIVKSHLSELKPGYDFMLLTSKEALDLDYGQKEERLLKVFKKAGLL